MPELFISPHLQSIGIFIIPTFEGLYNISSIEIWMKTNYFRKSVVKIFKLETSICRIRHISLPLTLMLPTWADQIPSTLNADDVQKMTTKTAAT